MDNLKKYRKKRIESMYEIIEAIDHWLANWSKGQINRRVGALIQRFAMRELAFKAYLTDNFIEMDELRIKANDELERLGNPRVPKPIEPMWGVSMHMFYY